MRFTAAFTQQPLPRSPCGFVAPAWTSLHLSLSFHLPLIHLPRPAQVFNVLVSAARWLKTLLAFQVGRQSGVISCETLFSRKTLKLQAASCRQTTSALPLPCINWFYSCSVIETRILGIIEQSGLLARMLSITARMPKKGYNNLLQVIQQADGSVVHTIKHIHSWPASILQLHVGITAFLEAKESEFWVIILNWTVLSSTRSTLYYSVSTKIGVMKIFVIYNV